MNLKRYLIAFFAILTLPVSAPQLKTVKRESTYYKFLFLYFLICASFITAHAQTTDDEKYEQANTYYETKEYEKAIPLLKELADRNHAKALNLLGVCYNYGYSVPKNTQKAVELYLKSANLGLRSAQRNLGNCYKFGEGIPKNMEKAYSWYDKAFRQYKETAENGDADAQLEVGIFYYHERLRGGKDYLKALPWFEKSANQGNSYAFNYLGIMYNNAYGVEKDLNKAYHYYLKGAEMGNCYAQRNLAWLFQDEQFQELRLSDEDVNRQTEKWLRMAAKQDADYMYELAQFYLGMQVSDDWQDKDPYMYLRKAAKDGSAKAQACEGYLNLIKSNYDDAIKCFHDASENGITTFWTFDYAESEELSIDECLMILQYFKNNPDLKLDYSKKKNDGNFLLDVSKGEGNRGLIILSKNGTVIEKTPYFHNIMLYEDTNEHNPYPSISVSISSDEGYHIKFYNKKIQFDILDGIYRFTQQNNNYRILNANYNGGEYIYLSVCNEKEKYSFMKINKVGKIIKSTSFIENKIYVDCDEKKIELAFDENINLINTPINFDIIFAVLDFLLVNPDYRIDYWDAVFVNNSYLLIHVQRHDGEFYRDYKWFKLSPSGRILGKTTIDKDNSIWFSSVDNIFYYNDYTNGNRIEYSLQEMLERIK